MFAREDCTNGCLDGPLAVTWETLACKVRGRANVAVVDRGGNGAVTGRRFGITETPEFVL